MADSPGPDLERSSPRGRTLVSENDGGQTDLETGATSPSIARQDAAGTFLTAMEQQGMGVKWPGRRWKDLGGGRDAASRSSMSRGGSTKGAKVAAKLEDINLSAIHRYDLQRLPHGVIAKDIVKETMNSMRFRVKAEGAMWKKHFEDLKTTPQTLVDMCWWFLIERSAAKGKVPEEATSLQETMFKRIAQNYGSMFWELTASNTKKRDDFLSRYPSVLTKAVAAAFTKACPGSTDEIESKWKQEIRQQLRKWIIGFESSTEEDASRPQSAREIDSGFKVGQRRAGFTNEDKNLGRGGPMNQRLDIRTVGHTLEKNQQESRPTIPRERHGSNARGKIKLAQLLELEDIKRQHRDREMEKQLTHQSSFSDVIPNESSDSEDNLPGIQKIRNDARSSKRKKSGAVLDLASKLANKARSSRNSHHSNERPSRHHPPTHSSATSTAGDAPSDHSPGRRRPQTFPTQKEHKQVQEMSDLDFTQLQTRVARHKSVRAQTERQRTILDLYSHSPLLQSYMHANGIQMQPNVRRIKYTIPQYVAEAEKPLYSILAKAAHRTVKPASNEDDEEEEEEEKPIDPSTATMQANIEARSKKKKKIYRPPTPLETLHPSLQTVVK